MFDLQFKQKTHQICLGILDARILELKTEIKDLVTNAANDSKSTAGDKHETARAMMQREQEHLGKQVSELEKQKSQLARINSDEIHSKISEGSLIETNQNTLYIATALGKIRNDQTDVYVISNQSPMALKLTGHIVKESIEINGTSVIIKQVI